MVKNKSFEQHYENSWIVFILKYLILKLGSVRGVSRQEHLGHFRKTNNDFMKINI